MSDEGVKRSMPILATVGLHLALVVLVAILVANRHSIPHFGLLPFAMVPAGVWLLSSAAGYETVDDEEPAETRAPGVPCRNPERQLSRAYLETRMAMRTAGDASASGLAGFDPLKRVGKMWPAQAPSRTASVRHRPSQNGAYAASRNLEPAQPAASALAQPQAAAPNHAPAMAEPQPEWAVKVLQVLAAAAAAANTEAKPEAAPAQPAVIPSPAHAVAPAQPQPEIAISRPQPVMRKNGFEQTVPGIELPTHFSLSPVQPGPRPVLLHDMEIAADLRRRFSEEDVMVNPILAASAEDHEEWLNERTLFNPTHRKPGTSVKEQYEQWLRTRFEPGAEPMPIGGQAAIQ